MFHVRDVVSVASEVLRSSSPHALVMPEALACRRTVLVPPDRVTCCTWDSALRRAAAGSQKSRYEEAFAGRAGASLRTFDIINSDTLS